MVCQPNVIPLSTTRILKNWYAFSLLLLSSLAAIEPVSPTSRDDASFFYWILYGGEPRLACDQTGPLLFAAHTFCASGWTRPRFGIYIKFWRPFDSSLPVYLFSQHSEFDHRSCQKRSPAGFVGCRRIWGQQKRVCDAFRDLALLDKPWPFPQARKARCFRCYWRSSLPMASPTWRTWSSDRYPLWSW